MSYKYFIRKLKLNDKIVYIPYIYLNKQKKWKFLIYDSGKFYVSDKNFVNGITKIRDSYKFIARHRIYRDAKGKDRPTCLYFNETISYIPLIGLFYFLITYLRLNKLNVTYLSPNKSWLTIFTFIQSFTIVLFFILLIF